VTKQKPTKISSPTNSLLQFLGQFANILQTHLFPPLQEELGGIGDLHRKLVATLAMLRLDGFLSVRHGRGRPAHSRAAIARAFVAKAVFHIPHTRALLERLQIDSALRRICGWNRAADVPDETIFSRAFAELAHSELPQRVHTALIARTQGERLVGHMIRDSTAIAVREKANPKPAQTTPQPKPRYRRRQQGKPKPPEQMTRLERQCSGTMTPAQMIAELPRVCDIGTKTSSSGHRYHWIGYKLHLDVADGQIPITCLLTSASLHDTQTAVPMAEISAQRVKSLYDLMDKGYESCLIEEHSQKLGHVPIMDRQKRGEQDYQMEPHRAVRFRERTAVERVYGRLKDEFGGNSVRVRGAAKVMAHLMFGILALTVDQLLRLAPS
jgi:Transposase DDE domain/Transposase domain (DUF772)